MFGMNWEQIRSLLVKVLAIGGGFVIGKWGITSGSWEAITALVLAALTVIESLRANTQTAIVKAAEAQPAVKKIEVNDPAIVAATGPKVTS